MESRSELRSELLWLLEKYDMVGGEMYMTVGEMQRIQELEDMIAEPQEHPEDF